MQKLSDILTMIDDIVWGPAMLILLVGTGIFLTIRTKALCWRNLPYALRSVLSKEARKKTGEGDVSPFSALTTALAATIGTGNIVGVATAMVSGGPSALVWMWLSAAFGLTSKFSECMLAIKYREVNEQGEMSGGPMYTMKKGFRHKKLGSLLGFLFALFAVIASFGIGNLTQANSISASLDTTFGISPYISGAVITGLSLFIILGGIKSISKVSQVVVPLMAVFYMIAGLIIIIGNRQNLPDGIAMIFRMAFSFEAVGGGLCGSLVASMTQAIRFGVARGVFSNEAGMGSAAITAAAATTNDPVRQGYINMTGTFWDTIVVCTITGLVIASSGMLGATEHAASGSYTYFESPGPEESFLKSDHRQFITFTLDDGETSKTTTYSLTMESSSDSPQNVNTLTLTPLDEKGAEPTLILTDPNPSPSEVVPGETFLTLTDKEQNQYILGVDGNKKSGSLEYRKILIGSSLTIAAFESVLGAPGGWLVAIGIALFAFSTILGWEYHGEKAFEYLFDTHRYNMIYRVVFSLMVFVGATTTLTIAWSFSDIANALMAIPNLICLLGMSGVIAKEMNRFQKVLNEERAGRKNRQKSQGA